MFKAKALEWRAQSSGVFPTQCIYRYPFGKLNDFRHSGCCDSFFEADSQLFFFNFLLVRQQLVYDAVFNGFFGGHVVVTVGVFFDFFQRLAGVFGQ